MDDNMNVTREGDHLVIRIKIKNPLEESATKKTLVVASSHGNRETDVVIEGKKVKVGVNAYVSKRG